MDPSRPDTHEPNGIWHSSMMRARCEIAGLGQQSCALTDKVRERSKTLTLDVMKNNRSRLLYERLGFQVIGQSEYKLKMQWKETAQYSKS